jgi:molybdopterin-synthase adenylyltransferase
MAEQTDRYHRQALVPQIGREGQARIGRGRVLVVGCGALGSVIADQVVRAGVGLVRLVDRDIVELTNLQRQVLFDERDVAGEMPKAVAAAERLRRVNSSISIDAHVADVSGDNIERLMQVDNRPVDLVLDGTDNVATRYLINDACVKHGVPWVYGACVGVEGRMMLFRPGVTACMRCIFPTPPSPGELATCDTAGVLGPLASVIGSLQALVGIKLLSGDVEAVHNAMLVTDVWHNHTRPIDMSEARRADCIACARGEFEFLEAAARDVVSLCGRDAVQIRGPRDGGFDLERVGQRLGSLGQVQRSPFFLRCALHDPEGIRLTIFPDGRTLVHGTADLLRARSLHARYVGA